MPRALAAQEQRKRGGVLGLANATQSVLRHGLLARLVRRDAACLRALLQQRAKASGTTPEEARQQAMAKDGLRRIGQPEDVAELALFLSSERARHIQGAAISVDGGQTSGLF